MAGMTESGRVVACPACGRKNAPLPALRAWIDETLRRHG